MIFWVGVLLFVAALLLSVVLHEAGHFLTAKAFGMKATRFFVGFGPTLFSRQRGETEYGVKLLPAGGFVKIVGMTPMEDVAPEDVPRAFYGQPTPQRVTVLAAGSLVHFLIAIVLGTLVAFFQPVPDDGLVVDAVSPCTWISIPSGQSGPPKQVDGRCPSGSVVTPASALGLRPGDVLESLQGTTLTTNTVDDPASAIRKARSAAGLLTYRRGAELFRVPVTLASVHRDRGTGGPGTDPVFALGVSTGSLPPSYHAPTFRQGANQLGVAFGTGQASVFGGMFYALGNVGSTASHLFSSDRASSGGAQISSVVGVARVTGDIFAASHIPTSYKIWSFVQIVALVNASVGIINLLPVLPFDGGHIAVTLAERWSRRRRRTVDVGKRIGLFYRRAAPAMWSVAMVIIGFSLLVLVADVRSPSI